MVNDGGLQMKSKNKFNSTLGELTPDLLGEFNDMDLSDKKVSVIVSDKEKIKVNQEFVLMFVDNVQKMLDVLTVREIKVLLSIVKFCSYRNVYKITQKTIANDIGIEVSNVCRIMKRLKENNYLLTDENGTEYVNPYLFLKGGIKEFKSTETFKQLSLHFHDENIKNPY